MPVRTVETAPGVRVLDFRCDAEGCGSEATYGENSDIREAMRTGDQSKAGRWWCSTHAPAWARKGKAA